MEKKEDNSFASVERTIKIIQIGSGVGLICGLIAIGDPTWQLLSIAIFAALMGLALVGEQRIAKTLKKDIDKQVAKVVTTKSTMFYDTPIPVITLEKSGVIKWANRAFLELYQEQEIIGHSIRQMIPNLTMEEMYHADKAYTKEIEVQHKYYDVYFEHTQHQTNQGASLITVYFIETTQTKSLKEKIKDQRCMIGYICIDNYDEIMHSIEEVKRPMLTAIIDRKLNLWFKQQEVVLTRLERDKYMIIFTKKELMNMENRKFDVLDELRQIQMGNELPVSISIGIGYNLASLMGSKEDARAASDLAQGRGGDQAIIKNQDKYTFYGGKTKEVEKSARVKVRIKAYAFKELLLEADNVYIMGHKGMDMDCLGAAMGVYRAAAIMGKKAQILLNKPTFAIQSLYDRIVASNEYEDLFVTETEACSAITKDSLVVIVDVHRKSYLECAALLEKTDKVVIFDHHRRSTDFIEDAVLTYIEPFISSTCEMISEILNYLTDKIKLTQIEADALLAGITIDTKNFVFKAGVRTFEAAAFLRRNGADSTRVRLFFQNDMETYRVRAAAIKEAQLWHDSMAVSTVDGVIPHAPIIAAQVADELLNIKGIQASFVLTQKNEDIMISARASGDVNVQRIMELLGGGGHIGIAGAQLKEVSIEQAKEKLSQAIEKYFEEGE